MAHEQASRSGKAQTEGRCVFTGTSGVDGAHCFPAGDFRRLADVPENIFTMNRNYHSVRGKPCFDFVQRDGVDVVRPVSQRLWMLENLTIDEPRSIVRKKLSVVRMWCEMYDIEYPEPEKPEDYEKLIYQGRLC